MGLGCRPRPTARSDVAQPIEGIGEILPSSRFRHVRLPRSSDRLAVGRVADQVAEQQRQRWAANAPKILL
jgi:hypothetical protein